MKKLLRSLLSVMRYGTTDSAEEYIGKRPFRIRKSDYKMVTQLSRGQSFMKRLEYFGTDYQVDEIDESGDYVCTMLSTFLNNFPQTVVKKEIVQKGVWIRNYNQK